MAETVDARARLREREDMVEHQIVARGVRDARVLEALRRVPRERFVSAELASAAHEDRPLPIGEGQTISQPYIVAYMVEAAELHGPGAERVLEIGTGCGYAAAVLAECAHQVYSVERNAALAVSARERLAALGYADRVHVRCGDGTLGWPEAAPFDAIVVSAGGPEVPASLRDQLVAPDPAAGRPGGRLIIPVGPRHDQTLLRIRRIAPGAEPAAFRQENLGGVAFVPLIGAEGWPEA